MSPLCRQPWGWGVRVVWGTPKPGPECEGLPPVQLYDLSADVGERENVQDRHPEVVGELTALLTR